MRQKWIFVCTIAICFQLALTGCDKGGEQKAELDSVKADLKRVKAASKTTETERDTLKKELAAVSETRDELQTQVDKLTAEEEQLREQIDTLTGSSNSLAGQVTGLTTANERLAEQLKEATGSRDKLKGEVAGLKSKSEGLQTQVGDLTMQRDAAIAKAKEAQGRVVVLTAKLRAATGAEPELLVPPTALSETSASEGASVAEAAERPTIHSFDTARTKISKGQNATLSWHVTHADRISIEPGVGSVSALGSKNVKPSKTTTYTLTAANEGGETVETCKVTVR